MAYNQMAYGSQGPPPFFHGSMAHAEFQSEEETDINSSWYTHADPSMSQIDPSILGLTMNNTPPSQMSFQVQQQVQLQSQEYGQQPIQRYIDEPDRSTLFNVPSIHSSQVFPRGINRPGAPTQALPQVHSGFMRNTSPSLSQSLSSATSAPSPNTEYDWYPESRFHSQHREEYNLHTDYYASPPSFASSPPAMESHFYQQYSLPAAVGNSCVNMSQVQGFADPQEVTYEADESYDDEAVLKDEYNMSFEKHSIKTESRQLESRLYEYHTDSAVGSSIKDAPSPDEVSTRSIHVADGGSSDMDAEGEADDNDIIEVEQASDTEYTPRSTRTRKRPTITSKSTTTPNKSRNRVTKSTPNKTGKLTCKSCDVHFKDIATLTKHIGTAHTRAFVCVFAFAGCASTFASKNEWKRHVSSQHLNLAAWVCEIGTCGKVHNHGSSKSGAVVGSKGGSEFNRKDLFTQHLRRMHAPHSVKRKKETDDKWERELKDLQVSCLKVKREAPTKLACCVSGCAVEFEGPNTWDERMEHVGKHLEKAAAAGERDIGKVVDQGQDPYLVSWALRERIVEERPDHTLRLCVGKKEAADDEDAEGEIE